MHVMSFIVAFIPARLSNHSELPRSQLSECEHSYSTCRSSSSNDQYMIYLPEILMI
jgi:hypothetical protein